MTEKSLQDIAEDLAAQLSPCVWVENLLNGETRARFDWEAAAQMILNSLKEVHDRALENAAKRLDITYGNFKGSHTYNSVYCGELIRGLKEKGKPKV